MKQLVGEDDHHVNISLAQLTPVCFCGQEVPSSNPQPNIYMHSVEYLRNKNVKKMTEILEHLVYKQFRGKLNMKYI